MTLAKFHKHISVNLVSFIMFLVCAAFFLIYPETDINFSRHFYSLVDDGFFLRHDPLVKFIHNMVPVMLWTFVVSITTLYAFNYFTKRNLLGIGKRQFLFLIISLALGPGLVVNTIFKDQWGRARPSQIEEFGGTKTFAPAFHIGDQCVKNCSFVSGHASVGFYIFSIAMIAKGAHRLRLMIIGFLAGGAIGLGRIVEGGHFLSDVIFCGFFVYFVSRICANIILKEQEA